MLQEDAVPPQGVEVPIAAEASTLGAAAVGEGRTGALPDGVHGVGAGEVRDRDG
ncbi:hypothetical protein [Geodermatophilus sp. SYSU D01105]